MSHKIPKQKFLKATCFISGGNIREDKVSYDVWEDYYVDYQIGKPMVWIYVEEN